MSDVSIRTISAPEPVAETPHIDEPVNNQQVLSGPSDIEPLDTRPNIVLEALGIEDPVAVMPQEDQANLGVVKEYVKGLLKTKGLPETAGSFVKALNSLKSEMGLSEESDPQIILDRISGVVRAWEKLSFVQDSTEKRKLFLSLANMKSSSEMNKKVFDYMTNYQVWL